MGVFIAVLIVAKIDLPELLNISTLNDAFSLAFFAWFVGVFIWLASRATKGWKFGGRHRDDHGGGGTKHPRCTAA